jgi:predicted RNA-binding protein YlqC (UPF0109 family)
VSVIEDALDHLIRGIVDNPDEVSVRSRTQRRSTMVEVRVHPDDLGRVIGRGGRTAGSLRTVVDALAGHRVRVDIVDTVARS